MIGFSMGRGGSGRAALARSVHHTPCPEGWPHGRTDVGTRHWET